MGDPRERAEQSLLAGRDVEYIPYVGVRDVPSVLRCVLRAHALYRQRRPTRAVSTGSGIALGYLPYLAARGVDCHYIESAARVSGPSLTGPDPALGSARAHLHPVPALERRALALRRQRVRRLRGGARRPPVRRPDQGRGHRRHRGGVPVPASDASRSPSCWRPAAGWRRPPAGRCRCCGRPAARPSTTCRSEPRPFLPAADLTAALADADIVVSHAGTGSALANLAAGRFAVMVSRVAAFGEAGDDHQAELAQELAARGLAVHRSPDTITVDDLLATRRSAVRRADRGAAVRTDRCRGALGPERAVTSALTLVAVDPAADPRWAELAAGPGASLFTSPPWIAAVCGTYGFTPQARIAGRTGPAPRSAGWPGCAVDDARGRRLLSLPFCDRADPLVPDAAHLGGGLGDASRPPRCPSPCAASTTPLRSATRGCAWSARRPGTGPRWTGRWTSCTGGSPGRPGATCATAARAGVTVQVRRRPRGGAHLHRLHVRLRKRKYRLLAQPLEFFERIWSEFAPGDAVRHAAGRVGRPADRRRAVTSCGTTSLYYKFGASRGEHLPLRPNDAIHWAAIRLGRRARAAARRLGAVRPRPARAAVASSASGRSVERALVTLRGRRAAGDPGAA